MRSLTVTILKPCSRANSMRSAVPATDPSSRIISQITAAGVQPASLHKSTEASVCPARTSTPPSRARSGKVWPGRVRCSGREVGSTSTWMVRALSAAEAPVVTRSRASTVTVKCFDSGDVLRPVMSGMPSASRRSPDIATHTRPRARLVMNAITSAVTNWAGMQRSPSFSRPSSSTMRTGRPWRNSSIASSTVACSGTARPRPSVSRLAAIPTSQLCSEYSGYCEGITVPRARGEPGTGAPDARAARCERRAGAPWATRRPYGRKW